MDQISVDSNRKAAKASVVDRYFVLLACFGPLFWLTYYIYLPVTLQLSWPLDDPLRFGLLVAVFPVLEEIVFRGLIQEWLAKHLSQRIGILSLANVVTSLAFAGLHLVHQSLMWSGLIFFPSLIFGFSKERYQTLCAPILLHSWYNLGFVWLFSAV